MKKLDLGRWLFLYFTGVTAFFGFFLILFGRSLMKIDDPIGVFAIFIPTLVGQITILFKWFADNSNENSSYVDIPPIIVKVPPLMILGMFSVAVIIKIIGFNLDAEWTPSDDQFKGLVTVGLSILNATTVYLVSKLFQKS